MNYADIKKYDVANGYGIRLSLFVSGCPHHCKNCFNKETWDFNYGKVFGEKEENYIINELISNKDVYDGITILGGEPMAKENVSTVLNFIDKLNKLDPSFTIWLYSGYIIEELVKQPIYYDILTKITVLVDGPFIEEEKDLRLLFRGSRNQRIFVNKDYDIKDENLKKEISGNLPPHFRIIKNNVL